MAFGQFDAQSNAPMAEINTTPLVDVMLVLLVVFIITAPLLTQTVPLDLPQAKATATTQTPSVIRLSIQKDGSVFWDDTAVSPEQLPMRLKAVVQSDATTELHLFADKNVRYEVVAKTLAVAQEQGIHKIGFMTQAPN